MFPSGRRTETVTDLISSAIRGIPFGCVFALVAVSLVLTYRTTGVFNLAFGAQAFVSAAVYYDTRVRHEWPIVAAFLLAVVVVGPLVGFILDRCIFRSMRSASDLSRLVASLGLLVAIPPMVLLWFGPSPSFGVVGIWPSSQGSDFAVYHWGRYALNGDQLATLIATSVVCVALFAMFKLSNIGMSMRSVVESPRPTEQDRIEADRIGTCAWMLSGLIAGLSGVLLAPLFAQVTANNFTILIVAALAAAVFGKLSSIPLTILGGIALGVLGGVLVGSFPARSVLAQGVQPSLPFVVLFVVLIFSPALRRGREIQDPPARLDPPPVGPDAIRRRKRSTRAIRIFGLAACLGAVAFVMNDTYWLFVATQALVLAVIFLSFPVITGMARQVSLCQATFAAIGAFATAQLVHAAGVPVILSIVVGAFVAAIVGAVIAIPVLRLGGIYLALVTLAFALMFESALVPLGWVSGGTTPVAVPRPVIGPVDFAGNRSFFFLCLAILIAMSALVILVRSGATGRFLEARRGSKTTAQAIEVSPSRARVAALALSAGIAGLGGGLYASFVGSARPADYALFFSLFFVVLVVTLDPRTVEGAIFAAVAFVVFREILERLGLSASWEPIFFGLGAIVYAKNSKGILEAVLQHLDLESG